MENISLSDLFISHSRRPLHSTLDLTRTMEGVWGGGYSCNLFMSMLDIILLEALEFEFQVLMVADNLRHTAL